MSMRTKEIIQQLAWVAVALFILSTLFIGCKTAPVKPDCPVCPEYGKMEAFVIKRKLFVGILWRDIPLEEEDGQRDMIRQGKLVELAKGIVQSDEFKANIQPKDSPLKIVEQFYRGILGRDIDDSGKAAYVDSGMPYELVVEYLVTSQEFKDTALVLPPLMPKPELPVEPEVPKRHGKVRASGRALADDDGEFHALGATMMWALWAYKNDREMLDRNLKFLSQNGFHYIRALGVIDRKIETDPNKFWYPRHMAMEWPDYDEMIAGLTDYVYDKFGMRIEWTLFGGAADFNDAQKQQLIDKFLAMSKGREHKIIHFEIANEHHGTGWGGDEGTANLRKHTKYMLDRTDIMVAASSPYGDWAREVPLLYKGLGADIGTLHFDRDTSKGDGFWRPVRQPWEYQFTDGVPAIGSNNEPIGPGSSVASDTDVWTQVSAVIVSRIAGLPLHVYHGENGVRGMNGSYAENHRGVTEGFKNLNKFLPGNITNWQRENHHWAGHPFSTEGEIGYPPATGSGCVRNYAAHSGNEFISFPIGIKDYVRVRAKSNLEFDVIHPLTGDILQHVNLKSGEHFDVRGAPALVLKGYYR